MHKSSFGLGLGQGNPFVVGNDGAIVPQCIDPQTGELKLDKDGFPEGMNFWAGMDGQVYVRGNIYATGGEFNGVVKATDFQLPSGDSMVSILNSDKKISSDWLDLMGINVKDENGNTVMTIDGQNGITIQKGSISWGAVTGTDEIDSRINAAQSTANSAASAASSASSMARQIANGQYHGTWIDGTKIYSPEIYAGSVDSPGGQIIGLNENGMTVFGGDGDWVLRIWKVNRQAFLTSGINPIQISTPNFIVTSGDIDFSGNHTIDFTGAQTKGLHATFA